MYIKCIYTDLANNIDLLLDICTENLQICIKENNDIARETVPDFSNVYTYAYLYIHAYICIFIDFHIHMYTH